MCVSYSNTDTDSFKTLRAALGLGKGKGKKRGGEAERMQLFRSSLTKYFREQGCLVRNLFPSVNEVSRSCVAHVSMHAQALRSASAVSLLRMSCLSSRQHVVVTPQC